MGVAQNIDQLQAAPVLLSQFEHFCFRSAGAVCDVAKAKMRPKFPDASGDKISVFVQICGRSQRICLSRVAEAFDIEHLPARDVAKYFANISEIGRVLQLEQS